MRNEQIVELRDAVARKANSYSTDSDRLNTIILLLCELNLRMTGPGEISFTDRLQPLSPDSLLKPGEDVVHVEGS